MLHLMPSFVRINNEFMQKYAFILLFAGMGITACQPDDPVIPNEEEVITTLQYTLTDNNNNTVIFTFKDLDGDGGTAPLITITDTLRAHTVYEGAMSLRNEAGNDIISISDEVEDESEFHQLFYSTTINDLTISYADEDINGHPIGLFTKVQTGSSGQGEISIILRHNLQKTASGVSQGDITNAGGETDISVTFSVNVQ